MIHAGLPGSAKAGGPQCVPRRIIIRILILAPRPARPTVIGRSWVGRDGETLIMIFATPYF